MVFQNHLSRSFRLRRGVLQRSVVGPVLFFLFIDDLLLLYLLPPAVLVTADDLAIWSSSSSVPAVVEAIQGALIRLNRWLKYWCLSLSLSKCEAFFFSVDLHQANF